MKNTFFCVQPLELKTNDFINIFQKNLNKTNLNNYRSVKYPKWMQQIININDLIFEEFIPIKLKKIDNKLLKFELDSSLKEYFLEDETQYYLLLDIKLGYFILCYELKFDFKDNLEPLKFFENEEDNIYMNIRKLLVKETSDSEIANWTTQIEQYSFSVIKELILNVFDYKIDINHIKLKINTGNITNFIDFTDEFKSKKIKKIKELTNLFIDINKITDRFENKNSTSIKLNEYEEYYFGGRFHTVSIIYNKNLLRFYPLQFQMQFNWFYALELTKMYKYFNDLIYSDNFNLSYEKKKPFVNSLINKILVFETKNEFFKLVIENDNDLIFNKIEKKWNIDNTLKILTNYIKEYEKYLNKEFNEIKTIQSIQSIETKNILLKKIEELKEEKNLLEIDSYVDFLTNCFNRKKLFLDLEEKKSEEFFITFIDVDNFKIINDTYGHPLGDVILKLLSSEIKKLIKNNFIEGNIYRIGGEEFIIIIENEKVEDLLFFLNMIREHLSNLNIETQTEDGIINFTISLGVTKKKKEDDFNITIKEADILLYKAKKSGKNRVEHSDLF